MLNNRFKLINREKSWLAFNGRVLQEAADPEVPLVERLRFLGIFSNNLDEFFRVRVATIKRMAGLDNKKVREIIGGKPKKLLKEIQSIVIEQQGQFQKIYQDILEELEKENIFIINEQQLNKEQGDFVQNYFHEKVSPALVPIMMHHVPKFPHLKDKSIYLAVKLSHRQEARNFEYALIELPTDKLSRFVVLPSQNGQKAIIILDDVVRYCLQHIFSIFTYNIIESYTIKLTRDAELDIDHDISNSFLEKIKKSVKQRQKGVPVRFVYDRDMPEDLLHFLKAKIHLDNDYHNLIPGGRYHNAKDFMNFPNVGHAGFEHQPTPPLPHQHLSPFSSIFQHIRKQDIMLHYPYQSFHYFINMIREAAIDPSVCAIKITLYRVANDSKVVNALINAAKNGKSVTVIVELRARFDEEANIHWSHVLQEEGVKVIFGMEGLKMHSKICLISRRENGKVIHYANIATGNYNENTAKLYCDIGLYTADKQITSEVNKVFHLFENTYKRMVFKHLILSPVSMRNRFIRLINNEIKNSKAGKPAYMILKMNSLVDPDMIKKIYEASCAGVKIKLLVRGMCSLVPGIKKCSENIEAISIVDKYLEHARVFVFCNGGDELYFISSADWMPRNLDHRIEVTCPVYDKELQKELRKMLDIQLSDNIKSRLLNLDHSNEYRVVDAKKRTRAQVDFYKFLEKKHRH